MQQTSIPPGQTEWVGEHRGWQIYRCKDGWHEAWKAWGRKEKARPKISGQQTVWNGRDIKGPIILPSEDYNEACKLLDNVITLKRPAAPIEIDSKNTLFPELFNVPSQEVAEDKEKK
jgi:hypothetical protein